MQHATKNNWVLILFEPFVSWVTSTKFSNMSGLQILFENKKVYHFKLCTRGSEEHFHEGYRAQAERQVSTISTFTKAAVILSKTFILPSKYGFIWQGF